jgi:hypothetical protein
LGVQPGKDGQHLGIDGIVTVGEGLYGFLAQVTDATPARDVDFASRGLVNSGQNE